MLKELTFNSYKYLSSIYVCATNKILHVVGLVIHSLVSSVGRLFVCFIFKNN